VNYSFLPEAEVEYLQAVGFFEERRPGLGADLIADFERVMELVVERPKTWKTVHPSGVRRIGLSSHFPCFSASCQMVPHKLPPSDITGARQLTGSDGWGSNQGAKLTAESAAAVRGTVRGAAACAGRHAVKPAET
jgi:hypothetical protein